MKGKKFWLVCGLILVTLFGSMALTLSLMNREIARPLETHNATGITGKMFIIYRPGLSAFPDEILDSFIEGAISKDWQIELSTVSTETPTNITEYDIIILLSPVYAGNISIRMNTYLETVDFENKPVVLLLTYGSDDSTAKPYFNQSVTDANGIVLIQESFLSKGDLSEAKAKALALGANPILIENI